MSISKTIGIILIVSIFVALIISMISFIITRVKINKIKKDTFFKQTKFKQWNKIIERKNAGELLWDLKDKSINPLEDNQLEFLINTAIRNDYKTFKVINSASNYEATSLTKIAKLKERNLKPDLIIIFNKDFNKKFDESYKMLKQKQMIAIINANKKHKDIKNFINHLKIIKAKYDIAPIGKGIILIVK